MSLNLSSFIKRLLPSFEKSDLESDLEISLDAISAITETYSNLEQVLKATKLEAKLTKETLKDFYQELQKDKPKVKLSPQQNIAADTLTLFANIKANGEYISKEISEAVNDVIVSQALTAYKANLLRAVAHYAFMTRFALDLANFFYTNEVEASGADVSKEYKLNKKQVEFITKNIWVYARLVSVYGSDEKSFEERISSIEEVTLPSGEVDEVIDGFAGNKIDVFNNLPSGFIGSPIYSIRLVFAEWEATRYQHLKNQKKLLELRLLHMKMLKESGQNDVNLEKEINHLQKRATDVDHQIARIEEDLQ